MIVRKSSILSTALYLVISIIDTETWAFSVPHNRIAPRCHSPFPNTAHPTTTSPLHTPTHHHHPTTDQLPGTLLSMCICIDCARVNSCVAYHFIERKHEQPHMTDSPTFEPRDGSPTIHVNIRNIRSDQDREDEMKRQWSAKKRLEEGPEGEDTEGALQKEGEVEERREYDATPLTTYEYDVVACADYVEDRGCWVRNMPEEIKMANPDFVPP